MGVDWGKEGGGAVGEIGDFRAFVEWGEVIDQGGEALRGSRGVDRAAEGIDGFPAVGEGLIEIGPVLPQVGPRQENMVPHAVAGECVASQAPRVVEMAPRTFPILKVLVTVPSMGVDRSFVDPIGPARLAH